jgi:glycosyltransferase involved in cell wall biosynthesis
MAADMPVTAPGLKVTFLTQYFPPEVGAPQGRMYELAKRLTDMGHTTTVVTAFPNYPTGVIFPGYTGKRFMEEWMDGVRVLRTWVFATPNRGFFKRVLMHFSFTFSSLTAIRRLGKTDVIFVQSPPLLIGLATLMFSRLKGAPFVFNVSDIWPQSAIELGMLRNPIAIRVAEMFERHLYRRASRITVPVPGMVDRLAARGIPRDKLVLLTNGVDTTTFQPQPPDPEYARQLGLDGRKMFLYAGTHGLSHGLDVILEAAKLTNDPDILYVLAGEGADKAALVSKAKAQHLTNVLFLPNQPRSMMPALLNLAYASILSLKRLELFRSALPAKMYEYMAVGQPMVAAVWGEAADLIGRAQCGVVVEPEDPRAMQKAVESLAADAKLAKQMGQHGREFVIQHFDRKDIAERLANLLQETARPRTS